MTASFSACQNTNNTVHNESGTSSTIDEENRYSQESNQNKINVKICLNIVNVLYWKT